MEAQCSTIGCLYNDGCDCSLDAICHGILLEALLFWEVLWNPEPSPHPKRSPLHLSPLQYSKCPADGAKHLLSFRRKPKKPPKNKKQKTCGPSPVPSLLSSVLFPSSSLLSVLLSPPLFLDSSNIYKSQKLSSLLNLHNLMYVINIRNTSVFYGIVVGVNICSVSFEHQWKSKHQPRLKAKITLDGKKKQNLPCR